jgi:hypothetical protein
MSGFDGQRSSGPLRPGDETFVQSAQSRRDTIHRCLAQGFRCDGELIGGRWRPAFTESGLRSDGSHVLRRLVHLTPRAGKLQSGRNPLPHETEEEIGGIADGLSAQTVERLHYEV